MKYTSDQYLKSTILFKKIITGLLIFWGISSFLPYGFKWLGYGLIPLGIGIAILVRGKCAKANRRKLKRIVLFEATTNPHVSIDEISRSTGISIRDLRVIILDLKVSGELRGKISYSTEQMKHIVRKMKDTRNQYFKSVSLAIITGMLLISGIVGYFGLLIGVYLFGWGLIPLVIGIGFLSRGIASRANRRKLKRAVLDEVTTNPDASVDEISRSIGIISNHVIKIMLDLKASGEILGKFSSSTRQTKQLIIPAQTEMKFSKEKPSEKKENHCPNCGTAVAKEPVEYCAYCGAKLTLSPFLF